MLLGLSQQDVEDWNKSMHSYQKSKRTKRPFGKQQPPIERKKTIDVVQNQMRFNPVLQSYRDQRQQKRTIQQEEIQKVNDQIKFLKNNYKYNTDYDIVNLSPSIALPPKFRASSLIHDDRKRQYKDLTYQQFDIINGKEYSPDYLEKVRLKQLKIHQRNIRPKENRSFNIISGKYTYNHEEKMASEIQKNNQEILNKSEVMRTYDSINGRFYDDQIEKNYQKDLKQHQMSHGKDLAKKLPPSYVYREPFVQGQSQEVPEIVKVLDERKEKAKQRFKLRYLVDDQYKTRNEYFNQKKEIQAKNRVHFGRVLQEKAREFNILNAQRYENNRAERLFGKQITGSPYEIRLSNPSPIKQRAFSIYDE